MNRKIGNDEYGVKNNKPKISFGGKFIRNMIKDNLYNLANNMDMVEGGPWTWVDRQDSSRRSCLDLVVMLLSLSKVQVDVDQKFTPRRVIRRKRGSKSIFTDHFSLKLELKGIERRQTNYHEESTWNRGKPGAWEKYEKISNEAAEKIKEANERDQYQ
jgi:hypothetical protein